MATTDENAQPATTRTPRARAKKSTTTKPTTAQPKLLASDIKLDGLVAGHPRQTLPTNANIFGNMPWAYLPRRQYDTIDLSTLPQGALQPQQIMELLADASPDVGQALWNIQRLASADWSYDVRTPDNAAEDPASKALLDALLERINRNNGGFEALLGQWTGTVGLQGAACGECIPTPELDGVDDVVSVQPWTIYFQRDADQKLVPFQWQPMLSSTSANASGAAALGHDTQTPAPPASLAAQLLSATAGAGGYNGFRRLNEETFGYVALDAFVDDPYGRLPFASVLQMIVFDAQLLKDLRQWSHVNAFGRMDVSVLIDRVDKLIPAGIRQNAAERQKFLTTYLSNIQMAYNGVSPDDTFIHFDDVTVMGMAAAGQTFQIGALFDIIEDRMFRSLHQLPILMGSNRGTTETWGSTQMEVYALGIQAIQKVVAKLAAHLLTIALRLLGSTGVVHFEFARIRSTDRIKDATAERMEIANAAAKRDEGWQTQDEASMEITGSKAVGPAPSADDIAAPEQPTDGGVPGDATPAPAKPTAAAGGNTTGDGEQNPPADEKSGTPNDKNAGKSEKSALVGGNRGNTVSDSSVPTAGNGNTDEERIFADALSRTLASITVRSSSSQPALVAATSEAQRQHTEALRGNVADYFRASSVPHELLAHITALHTNSATANARQTHPDVADAVRAVVEKRDLSGTEKAALVASIAQMLASAFPDVSETLATVLVEARTSAWDAAGREALARLGFPDSGFHLTNTALIARIQDIARERVAGIQRTTRLRLAGVIAAALAAGDSLAALETALRGALDRMANGGATGDVTDAAPDDADADSEQNSDITSRAESIAHSETLSAWMAAVLAVWSRNGVATKAWVTSGGPNVCQVCLDNAAAGPIPVTDVFPSGDDAPGAHPGCACHLESDDAPPDDLSADALWLGA